MLKTRVVATWMTFVVLASILSICSSNMAYAADFAHAHGRCGALFVYAANGRKTISAYAINASSGKLFQIAGSPFAISGAPLSVAVNPAGTFVYAASDDQDGVGRVAVFQINAATGSLTPIAGSPFAAGTQVTSLTLNPAGTDAYVLNANQYGNGRNIVSTYRINPATGVPAMAGSTDITGYGSGPITINPAGTFAYMTNYGANPDNPQGSVSIYGIDAVTGLLTRVEGGPFAAGNGANDSTTLNPAGTFAYVTNPRDNTLAVYGIDRATGKLTPVGGLVPTGNNPTSVSINPAGTFAYVTNSNQRDGSIGVYRINAATGALTQIAGSPFKTMDYPRLVAINPEGTFAYVMTTRCESCVSAYRINSSTGALTPIAGGPFTGSPFDAGHSPSSVTVSPAGTFAYVTNWGDNTISAYRINVVTGALTPITGSPFRTAKSPSAITINRAGTFAYVADSKGSTYAINSVSGALTQVDSAGYGAASFNPAGTFAYVADSDPIDGSDGKISAYSVSPVTGAFTPIGSPVATGTSPGQVMINSPGTFAYVANYGDNTISAYKINAGTGALTALAGSPFKLQGSADDISKIMIYPAGTFAYVTRNSGSISAYRINTITGAIAPGVNNAFPAGAPSVSTINRPGSFAYVINTDKSSISAYRINTTTGVFTAVGQPVPTGSGSMSAVTVNPEGTFVYVANNSSNNISAYSIDKTTGGLSPTPGSLFDAGQDSCK
ncbi:MAG: lactonase family protein [Acidiferrobacterales bacterium]